MEKRKKAPSQPSREAIKDLYREFILTEGKQPSSVFLFCKKNGVKETDFYKQFASFEAIEKAVWSDHLEKVKFRLNADKDFEGFTTREKILTFYFSFAESLKSDRSFLIHQLKTWKNPAILPAYLKGVQSLFSAWAKSVIDSGIQSGEIAKRPYLDQNYHHLLWMHFLFIVQFWAHDESPDFEKTDAAIEKSVNLAFEVIGKGILDSAIDFGKFLYQTSKN
jgi:hypothetical protein